MQGKPFIDLYVTDTDQKETNFFRRFKVGQRVELIGTKLKLSGIPGITFKEIQSFEGAKI